MEILLDLATAFDDAIIWKYQDGKPYQLYPATAETPKPITQGEKLKHQRKPFAFSMVHLKVGDKIIFDPLNLDVRVAGENKIEHEGRLWSLSAFAGTYMPDNMRCASEAYQGPKYFSFQGKTLVQLRFEYEKEANSSSQIRL